MLIDKIVDTGHGAIVFNKVTGVKNQIYKEGWHVMMPWFERPIIYDLQSRPLTLKSVTGSQGKIRTLNAACLRSLN